MVRKQNKSNGGLGFSLVRVYFGFEEWFEYPSIDGEIKKERRKKRKKRGKETNHNEAS